MRKPWESEDAAFSFLLRVLAIALVVVLLSVLYKTLA